MVVYLCMCAARFYKPRPLLKHLEETGHKRKISKALQMRMYVPLLPRRKKK